MHIRGREGWKMELGKCFNKEGWEGKQTEMVVDREQICRDARISVFVESLYTKM